MGRGAGGVDNDVSNTRILLVGSPRTGSIWAARMLAASPRGRCVVEPDNVNADRPARSDGFGSFPVLTRGLPHPEYAALWHMSFAGRVPGRGGWLHPLSRLMLRLPLALRQPLLSSFATVVGGLPGVPDIVVVQTVMAQFSAEWIVDRCEPQVVVIQRDPINMLSSWLEWDISGVDLHTRPEVRQRCAELGIDLPPIGDSTVSRTAWWIGLLTSALAALTAAHPDWVVVSHEALCADPESEFKKLYATLGLDWTAQASRYLEETGYLMPNLVHRGHGPTAGDAATVRAQVVQKWRERLTPDQVLEARTALAGFPSRGWVVPPVESAPAQQTV
jgi:hypothetical protein